MNVGFCAAQDIHNTYRLTVFATQVRFLLAMGNNADVLTPELIAKIKDMVSTADDLSLFIFCSIFIDLDYNKCKMPDEHMRMLNECIQVRVQKASFF